MDPSLPRLPLVVALLLGFAQADQVSYCTGICPAFEVLSTESGYQEREYEPVEWMCTEVAGSSSSQVLSARDKLVNFRGYQVDQGVDLEETWPGMVAVTLTSNGEEYKLCWMIKPGVTVSEVPQFADVTVESFPRTMFVKTFGGIPSIDSGHENAQALKNDLENGSFDPDHYFGVGYDPYLAFTHHNEIWIPKV